jgi:hypothetical protein
MDAEEVVELLEGPRQQSQGEITRIKCKENGGMSGWITSQDAQGVVQAEAAANVYLIKSAVAMTETESVKDAKVVRKLALGEVLVAEGEPVKEEAGTMRIKCTALLDNVAGWVTVTGNAGKVFADPSTRHYIVRKAVALQKSLSSTSEELRMFQEGDLVELLEGPQVETPEMVAKVRCRALRDGAVGWFTLKTDGVRAWSPTYTVAQASSLRRDKEQDSERIRDLKIGEIIEHMDGPLEVSLEGDATLLQVLGRAEKDGATGWVTVRDEKGVFFLDN